MQIKLNLTRKLFSDKFYPYLFDWSTRWFVLMGGAGSGKSYFITQKIILRCLKENIRFVVCRRYATTLRNSCFALFKEILDKWHLTPYVKIRETDMSITFPSGSQIIMMGLDEETKLLSLADISGIWVEEAYEVEQSKVEQLDLRMRGKANNQQIILSFNPISKASWLYEFCEKNPPSSFTYLISTYKDNPFLNKEYIKSLDEMAIRNPQKYRVYGLAEYGVNTDNLVFSNWRIEDFDPMDLAPIKGIEHRVGSDLGFIDPTTIVCSLYDPKEHRIYVYDCWYKRGCQLDEVAAQMDKMGLRRVKIYMDSAEPRSIEFFKRQGFNTVPCIKGRDSVSAGIAFLQNLEIIVSPKCKDLINELENFAYLEDKRTGRLTEDTDHEYSHAIDGLRYSVSDIYTNRRMKTISKSALGL